MVTQVSEVLKVRDGSIDDKLEYGREVINGEKGYRPIGQSYSREYS